MSIAPSFADRLARLLGTECTGLDAERFGAIYDRTHLLVFRYIYGLHGGPAEDVEDLTAETFLRAWRGRARFAGSDAAATGWLLQIARRLVIDDYRRRKVRPFDAGPPPELVVATDAGPEEAALASEQARILWQLLQELPADQREMLVLRYLLGWRVNAIARHFDLNENTVSTTLRRLLQRLCRDWPQG